MASTNEKICGICGRDCSNDPRTKDPKGRYFHRSCYEEAARRQAERREASSEGLATPQPERITEEPTADIPADYPGDLPRDISSDELTADYPPTSADPDMPGDEPTADYPPAAAAGPGEFALEADSIQEAPQIEYSSGPSADFRCPECDAPQGPGDIICTNCGFNAMTGEKLGVETTVSRPKKAAAVGGGFLDLAKTPRGVGLITLVAIAAFAGLGAVIEPIAFAYIAAAVIFYLGTWFVTIGIAFRQSIMQGLAVLFVPFYILFFIYFVSDNRYLRYLVPLSLIAVIAVGIVLTGQSGKEPDSLAAPAG